MQEHHSKANTDDAETDINGCEQGVQLRPGSRARNEASTRISVAVYMGWRLPQKKRPLHVQGAFNQLGASDELVHQVAHKDNSVVLGHLAQLRFRQPGSQGVHQGVELFVHGFLEVLRRVEHV